MHRISRLFSAAAALALVAGATVAVAPVASAAPATLYAYPAGAASSPVSCAPTMDLSYACSLADALQLAPSGATILLAAGPGSAGGTARFTTDTGWIVGQDSLIIKPDTGVTATLDGQHTASFVLKYTGSGTLNVSGLTVGANAPFTTIPITIENSAGSNDTSQPGGGIVNLGSGSVSVNAATVRGNTASGGYGGGIVNWSGGQVGAGGSTFTGNTATAGGQGGGIVNVGNGTVLAISATFDGNNATDGGSGGGIAASTSGTVAAATSTFTGNTTGSGATTSGGGIHSAGATLQVVASTFTDNTVAGSGDNSGNGGGLVATSGSVAGSVFAANGPDCGGAITDAGYNLDSDGSCGFTTGKHSASDVTALPGTLNQLADNGGPTETIAPQLGSAAAGFIPVGTSTPLGGTTVQLCPSHQDQRGPVQSSGRPCNAGSVQGTVGGERETPVTLYAYPGGTAYWPVACPQVTDLSQGCDLTDALRLAQSNDTVLLAANPGADGTATFTTDTGWTIGVGSLTIKSDTGATLDGQHTAPFLLHYTGEGPIDEGDLAASTGTLTVEHLTFTGTAVNGDNGFAGLGSSAGGGILTKTGGTFDITDSTFSDNTATGSTTIAVSGGGMVAVSVGGSPAMITVTDSTFSGNATTGSAGITLGGGILAPGSNVTVTGSTFDDNTVTGSDGAITAGGGIASFSLGSPVGTVAVSRSTFSGNTTGGGGAGGALGGGILNTGTASVVASTFTGNTVTATGDQTVGGGIVNGGAATLAATVFAGNGPDCVTGSGDEGGDTAAITDAGYNIDSDGSCGFTDAKHSISGSTGLAATLGALADNGGTTKTIAPHHDSPAVGMIPNGTSVVVGDGPVTLCPTTDQRGIASPAGAACNAGSVQGALAVEPGAPTGLTATAGDGTVKLAWTAPSDTGGAAVTYDVFQGTTAGGESGTPVNADPIAGTSHTVTGLANGTTYYFTVKAVNTAGSSGASNEAHASPKAVPAQVRVEAGNNQTAQGGTDFGARLAVTVSNGAGDPVGAGTTVTFAVMSGSASFAGESSATATTDASGVATAPTLTAGSTAGAVTITATVAGVDGAATFTETVTPVACSGSPFTDVPPTDPDCAYINWMVDRGITSGYLDDTFRPANPVTRQTMAAFLYRLTHDGKTAPACEAAPFTDVPVTNPFCGAITWLVDQGATSGYGDNSFRPTQAATNQTMAAFLYRLAHEGATAPPCSTPPFSDVPTSNPFCGAIAWAADQGIVTGSDGSYQPTTVVTRGAVAPVLFRYDTRPPART